MICPLCSYPLKEDQGLRCPRCNQSLIHLSNSCQGCGKCKPLKVKK